MSKTGTYNTYLNMVSRCTFEGHQDFAHYGGRGIKVCDRWLASFENFLSDMGVRPQRCTLERDDVNGNYEPGNCRWASWKDQQNNKRNNRLIEYAGRTQTLQQWADEVGFSHSLIIYRLARGWTVERALTIPPVSGRNQHTH